MKTVPELPGINIYYHSSLIDTDYVAYVVPISTSMHFACTFKKLHSLIRIQGIPIRLLSKNSAG